MGKLFSKCGLRNQQERISFVPRIRQRLLTLSWFFVKIKKKKMNLIVKSFTWPSLCSGKMNLDVYQSRRICSTCQAMLALVVVSVLLKE